MFAGPHAFDSIKLRESRVAAAKWRARGLVQTVCLVLCFTMLRVVPSAGQEGGSGSNKLTLFNIAPQPLGQALDAFTRTTGMAALVDQEFVAGRRSASVKGLLTPDQALRVLLAGTKLSARYATGDAFTLTPASTAAEHVATSGSEALRGDRQTYFADLQGALAQVLCRHPETQPGRYRLGLQLWIAPTGTIQASHLLDTTGDDRRDAIVTSLLASAKVAAPPAALPQPVTLVLMKHPVQSSDCRQAGHLAE
jgi:hypothetical protein